MMCKHKISVYIKLQLPTETESKYAKYNYLLMGTAMVINGN